LENLAFFAKGVLPLGINLAIIEYTPAPAAPLDRTVAEVRRSVRWLAEHLAEYGGDPNQLYVAGHSAGGHLTAMTMPGKVRYIGASSMHAWQFARALSVSERNGWTRFVSMQNLVNLLYREEEQEMLPLCAAEGIGVIPWSPQARGWLTRDWNYTSIRTETDDAHRRLFAKSAEADRKVVDRVAEVAVARGFPGPRWRWRGCSPSRSLQLRSSAPPSCTISTTLSHP
jgi:Aldo/keto reductase family/alpha/beta hydrolase fold